MNRKSKWQISAVCLSFFVLFLFSASGSIGATLVVDVRKIAGKSKQQVENYLGNARTCKKIKQGRKCIYRKGKVEIVYIDGKADWITVGALDHVLYSAEALSAIGLDPEGPDFVGRFLMRWKRIPGLLEVSIFRAGKKVDYAYIQWKTE